MDTKIFLIFAIIFSVSDSVPRIVPSTYRYILLKVFFLDGMVLHLKNNSIKFVECYKKIHDDYEYALKNFTDSMKNLSAQVYKKYHNFKSDEKRACYASILDLVDIGGTMMKFEDRVWESIKVGDYEKINFVYYYVGMMKNEVGELYDKFLKNIKVMHSRRFEREEAVKNDIALYRDFILNRLRALAHYFKLCIFDTPFKKIPEEIGEAEKQIIM